jgi:hypothetical protein
LEENGMSLQRDVEEALRAELQRARQNQARWLEMSPRAGAEPEESEQWATIAKLRRREVERLESLLGRNRGVNSPAEDELQSNTTPSASRNQTEGTGSMGWSAGNF